MKKIYILLLGLLFICSCVKEDFRPLQEEPIAQEPNHIHNYKCFKLWGRWELMGAKMYLTNLETGEEWIEEQFGYNDSVGSLRYDGPMYELEVLEKNKTVWTFYPPANIPGMGEFLLNNDSIDIYGLNVTSYNYTITEHPTTLNENNLLLGGSARPMAPTFTHSCKVIEIVVQESYENINGYNHNYYSILKFKKKH